MARRTAQSAQAPSDDGRTLTGRAVVINGGTTGIGFATASLLASQGARVLLFGHNRDEVNDAVGRIRSSGGEVYGVVADVTRQREVIRAFREADKRLGGVDVLINNAATCGETLLGSDYDDWRKALDTNIRGYLHCAREALDRMLPKRDGHVLMVGSMSADLREPVHDVYSATKAAVQALCEALRKNVNKDGIRVSLIEPGAVDTPLQRKAGVRKHGMKQAMEMIEPRDIAECIVFALSRPKSVAVVQMQVRPLKQLI